jgi:hypothetical protein
LKYEIQKQKNKKTKKEGKFTRYIDKRFLSLVTELTLVVSKKNYYWTSRNASKLTERTLTWKRDRYNQDGTSYVTNISMSE